MKEILYVITPLVGMVLLCSMVAQIIPLRYSHQRVLLVGGPTVAIILLRYFCGSRSLVGLLASVAAMLVMCVLVPLVLFEGPKWKRILVTLLFFSIQAMTDTACYSLLAPQYGPAVEKYPVQIMLLYTVASWSLYALIGSFFVFLFRSLTLHQFQAYYFVFLVLLLSQSLLAFWNLYPDSSLNLWLFSLVLGLVADIVLLSFTITYERRSTLEKELQSIRHTMILEQQHYQEVEERREKLAQIRHDFNNQLAVIGQLVRSGDEEDAQRMIQSLSEEIGKTRENPYCHIPVVNAILSEKAQECRQSGITLEVDLKLPLVLDIEPLKLCSVFSNLLDNAIQGVNDTGEEKAVISLTAKIEGDYLFIRTVNPTLSPKKQSAPGHGYGLGILRDIAKQYSGEYISSFEQGVYTAIITLLLNGDTSSR